ncbi:NAD-dependent epimerase/dehydratase family protein [Ramlibacter sp. G-1-2-2]|uniref:NAD-dependent epimerase/dehydratase family protein n=1 Tax=Ramlibacter agri TaxID=2728837 RepID=A0A848GX30_9BURK|nr:NAD-dependent epimerase/dehydratase family protein [Ramlibacter agri]NML42707.1 NAD-dependent epimerase/dehydratase family protein [Ramlibacter agri]
MSQVLVTGGTGFLGTHLCRKLRDQGHELVVLNSRNCDLTKQGSLEALQPRRYDLVFHLAAWTQAGDFCLHHPGEQWVINQQINTNVLAWWSAVQPQAKLVFIGTSCAYAPDAPLVEENYMDGEPIDSLYTYAMTKRMLYQGARALAKQYDLRWLSVVPSTLYGPGYHTDGRQMHFIFDLVRKIIRGKELGDPVVLWGDGHQKREIVYVDDFVDAMLALVPGVDNELVNLGAGEETSIRSFVDAICEIVGYDPARVQYDTARYVGARSKCLDVAKAQRLVPGYLKTSLAEGLDRTIAWFFQEQAYLR